MLEAYVRGVDLDRLGLEEESEAPFMPPVCGRYESCESAVLGTSSTPTMRTPVCNNARSVGEHAGVRRAARRGRVCNKLGGSAGRRLSQRRRVPCSPLRAASSGEMAPVSEGRCVGGEGDRSSRGSDDAGAHARHMRRRTPGWCQFTLPPRPIIRLSSASLPSLAASYTASLPPLAASHTALPIESLIASLELAQPICSARWWRRVLAARESRPTSFPDTQSERKSGSRSPKVRSMTSSTRALRRAPAGLPSWQGPARREGQ